MTPTQRWSRPAGKGLLLSGVGGRGPLNLYVRRLGARCDFETGAMNILTVNLLLVR